MLDADERPSKELLEFIKRRDFKYDIYRLCRVERSYSNSISKQLRLFKKGYLVWKGLVHERPRIKSKPHDAPKELLIYHEQSRQPREYNKVAQTFLLESKLKTAARTSYIAMKTGNLTGLAKKMNSELSIKRDREALQISRQLSRQGVISFLGLDKNDVVEHLYKEYYGKDEGADLLIELILKKAEISKL
jgi:hypothetical protein